MTHALSSAPRGPSRSTRRAAAGGHFSKFETTKGRRTRCGWLSVLRNRLRTIFKSRPSPPASRDGSRLGPRSMKSLRRATSRTATLNRRATAPSPPRGGPSLPRDRSSALGKVSLFFCSPLLPQPKKNCARRCSENKSLTLTTRCRHQRAPRPPAASALRSATAESQAETVGCALAAHRETVPSLFFFVVD